jgi:hypothetical protein
MTAHAQNPAVDAWIERAKGISTINAALRLGFRPKGGAKGTGSEASGPCPRCGGVDRFSVKVKEGLWNCRGCGHGGGDAISLAMWIPHERTFLEAVEFLTGEPKPGGTPPTEEEKAAIAARRAQQAAEQDKARAAEAQQQNEFREAERRRCREIWRHGQPAPGTLVEAYLRHRGIGRIPEGAKLRFHPEMHLRHPSGPGGAIVWTGPAMLSPIAGNDGRFMGLHTTWLDPRLGTPEMPVVENGKPTKGKLFFQVDGEVLDVKRSRGSKAGGHLVLAPAQDGIFGGPRRLVIGEGIETVLAVWITMVEAGEDLRFTEFWSAIDLGNLGGKAKESVFHPALKRPDSRGRMLRVRLPGPVPDMSRPERSIAIPDTAEDVLLLADGDSDRTSVEYTLARATARWARPGLTVRAAWPEEGSDFGDMRMRKVRADA